MRKISHDSWWLAVCIVLSACSPEVKPPIEYETTHLRVGSDPDEPLCGGDLNRLERIISSTESELGLSMEQPATVYLYTEEAWWSGANAVCGDETLGCYSISDHTINTVRRALEHELVHAVAREHQAGEFFDQGIAEVYGGEQSQFGRTEPSASIDRSGKVVDHSVASHFVRWLRARWGGEKLGELLHLGGSGSSLFEEIYGMTIEEAEKLYFEEAPFQYSSLYSCDGSPLTHATTPDEPRWREEIMLDCPGGDDTRVSGIGMIVHRTFDIPEPGYYTVHHDGYWFDIYRCSPERVEEAVYPSDHLYDDVPPEHGGFPDGDSRHYEGQPSWSLYMEAGMHDIGVGLLGHEAGTITLEIAPTFGPYPLPVN